MTDMHRSVVKVETGTCHCGDSTGQFGNSRDRYRSVVIGQCDNSRDTYRSVVTAEMDTGK